MLRPWRPFEDMERFTDEMLAGWPLRLRWPRIAAEEIAWAPSVDMYEKEGSFIVQAELPGVKKEDVDISITGDILTIKGECKAPVRIKEEEYHRCDVCYGPFFWSISTPTAVDTGKIEATYAEGILEVHLPKAKEAMPAEIQIRAKYSGLCSFSLRFPGSSEHRESSVKGYRMNYLPEIWQESKQQFPEVATACDLPPAGCQQWGPLPPWLKGPA